MEQKIERISCETAVGEKEVSLFRIPNSTNDFIELSTLGCTLKSICVHGPDGQMQELLAQPGTSLVQMEGLSDTLSKTVWEVAEVGDQHVFLTCCVQVPEGCEITLGAKILWVNLNRMVVDLYMTPAGEVTLAPSTSVYYKSNVTQASSVRTFCPSCMEDGAWKNTVDTAFKELTFLPLQKAEQFADPEVKDVRPMLELTEMTEQMAVSVYGDLGTAAVEPEDGRVKLVQKTAEPVSLKSGETWSGRVIYGVDRLFTKEELEAPAPTPFSAFF